MIPLYHSLFSEKPPTGTLKPMSFALMMVFLVLDRRQPFQDHEALRKKVRYIYITRQLTTMFKKRVKISENRVELKDRLRMCF